MTLAADIQQKKKYAIASYISLTFGWTVHLMTPVRLLEDGANARETHTIEQLLENVGIHGGPTLPSILIHLQIDSKTNCGHVLNT